MAWQDTIKSRPASFRGIAFEVEDTSGAFGRRVSLFEYPQRDKPYAEDMGRKARELTVNGFVVGDNYMLGRDDLIRAVEAPGTGTLVHPYLGILQVTVTDFQLEEAKDFGGIARFTFACVETGALAFPVTAIDPSAAVDIAADSALVKLSADWAAAFDSFADAAEVIAVTVAGASAVIAQIEQALFGPVSNAIDSVGNVKDAIDALKGNVESLLAAPGDLADAFVAVFQSAGTVGSLEGLLAGSPGDSPLTPALPNVPENPTPGQRAQLKNVAALDVFLIRAALAEYARALVKFDFTSYTEALEARDRIAFFLTDEMNADDTSEGLEMSAETYAALYALKATTVEGITVGAQQLSALVEVETPLTTTLTLAYAMYGDAERADEIEDRNTPGIQSPAFVSGNIRVLAE